MAMTSMPGTTPNGQGTEPRSRAGGVRIAGFSIRLTPGAYILAILVALVSATRLRAVVPGWPAGAYAVATVSLGVLVLASMIGHELAHAAIARRHGVRGREISVGFFGGSAHGTYRLPSPRALWHVAAAGPAVSLAAAGAGAAAAAGISALGGGKLAVTVLTYAVWINAVLGVVALLPGTGLDGGRILQALVWARTGNPVRARFASARTGQVTGAALAAGGLVALALGYIGGLLIALISLVMIAASRTEARRALYTAQLSGLVVRDVVPRECSPRRNRPQDPRPPSRSTEPRPDETLTTVTDRTYRVRRGERAANYAKRDGRPIQNDPAGSQRQREPSASTWPRPGRRSRDYAGLRPWKVRRRSPTQASGFSQGMKWPPWSWALTLTWLHQPAWGLVLNARTRSSAVWTPGGFS
jgi:Zn-dependent protease